jgi:hypothetical protein
VKANLTVRNHDGQSTSVHRFQIGGLMVRRNVSIHGEGNYEVTPESLT